MSPDPLPLETARTRLRRFTPADLAAFQALHAVETDAGSDVPLQPAGLLALLQRMQALPFCALGTWFRIAIADRDSDELLGEVGVQRHGREGSLAELGYALLPAARGRGLATEALTAVLALLRAQAEPPVWRVVSVADSGNAASLRLLQRLGLQPYATRPYERQGRSGLEQHWVLSFERQP